MQTESFQEVHIKGEVTWRKEVPKSLVISQLLTNHQNPIILQNLCCIWFNEVICMIETFLLPIPQYKLLNAEM